LIHNQQATGKHNNCNQPFKHCLSAVNVRCDSQYASASEPSERRRGLNLESIRLRSFDPDFEGRG
jgi:hypothetical protein